MAKKDVIHTCQDPEARESPSPSFPQVLGLLQGIHSTSESLIPDISYPVEENWKVKTAQTWTRSDGLNKQSVYIQDFLEIPTMLQINTHTHPSFERTCGKTNNVGFLLNFRGYLSIPPDEWELLIAADGNISHFASHPKACFETPFHCVIQNVLLLAVQKTNLSLRRSHSTQ